MAAFLMMVVAVIVGLWLAQKVGLTT